MLCFFICLATIPLTSVAAPAKLYPEPSVRIVSAELDGSGKYINVEYYLNSDFYSDKYTGNYFSIGYKFTGINKLFYSQFEDINKDKGRYVAKLKYPGVIGKVTIYTHYTNRVKGIDSYKAKQTIFAAPSGEKNFYHEVTELDTLAAVITMAVLVVVPETKVGQVIAASLAARIALDRGMPSLRPGQYMKITSGFENYKLKVTITIWDNKSDMKNKQPIFGPRTYYKNIV